MRPRLATLPYPIDDPHQKQDTQPFELKKVMVPFELKQETVPFDLCRAKPADAPRAAALAVKPHLPPRRAKVAVGALPSVVIEDTPDLGPRPRRR
jgi:hypothetical protein